MSGGSTGWPPAGCMGLAQALGVEVGYFFEELESSAAMLPPQQLMLLDLVRNYLNISDPRASQALAAPADRDDRTG
jgi:hypothetical protein